MTQKEKLETLTGEKFPEPTEPLIQREQIFGTPFWAIGTQQNGYHLIMGKYKLTTEPKKDQAELIEWLYHNQWNVQLSITICIVNDIINNQNKQ